jgi:hypothetical protein
MFLVDPSQEFNDNIDAPAEADLVRVNGGTELEFDHHMQIDGEATHHEDVSASI